MQQHELVAVAPAAASDSGRGESVLLNFPENSRVRNCCSSRSLGQGSRKERRLVSVAAGPFGLLRDWKPALPGRRAGWRSRPPGLSALCPVFQAVPLPATAEPALLILGLTPQGALQGPHQGRLGAAGHGCWAPGSESRGLHWAAVGESLPGSRLGIPKGHLGEL